MAGSDPKQPFEFLSSKSAIGTKRGLSSPQQLYYNLAAYKSLKFQIRFGRII